jgi:hypothetical protein
VSVPELPDIVISVPAANINVSVPESAVIVWLDGDVTTVLNVWPSSATTIHASPFHCQVVPLDVNTSFS